MKKHKILICLILLIGALTLSGCMRAAVGRGEGTNDPGADNPGADNPGADNPGTNEPGTEDSEDPDLPITGEGGGVIFDGDFKFVVQADISEEEYGCFTNLQYYLYDLTGSLDAFRSDEAEVYPHEVLVGRTNRPLSEEAYGKLAVLKAEGRDYIGYILLSDGGSIALAYDCIDSLEPGLDALLDGYLTEDYGKTNVDAGVLAEWKCSIKELYSERDAAIMAERFEDLLREINALGYDGDETVKALKKLYSGYSSDIYMWMADLYEPNIPCSCLGECPFLGDHGGGFYYSNSARDTDGFLPDIESTMQVLNFLRNTGMINDLRDLPESMKEQIVKFVKSTQSASDGYFYHPQWSGLTTTDERRGRDHIWALEILRSFGEKPYYSTGGVEGSLGFPGVSPLSHLTSPLALSHKAGVSQAVAHVTLDHLKSEESFKKYLDSQNWNDAYTTGNRLAAQVVSIKQAGLLDYLITYLNAKQKQNGMWDDQRGERASNGFLKISSIYRTAGVVIPRSGEAAEFCTELLLSDEPDGTVCWTYNLWYALDTIIELLERSTDESDHTLSASIRDTLRKNAPEYINATIKKYQPFIKSDGTFSFTPTRTSDLSQGMPVAVAGTNEGDVNATTISSVGLTGYMFSALGYAKLLINTENGYKLFIDRIMNPPTGGDFYRSDAHGVRMNDEDLLLNIRDDMGTGADSLQMSHGELVFTKCSPGVSFFRWGHIGTPEGTESPLMVFEADMCFDGFSVNTGNPFGTVAYIKLAASDMEAAIEIQYFTDEKNGKTDIYLRGSSGNAATISGGQRYNIRLIVNCNTGMTDFYIDGELVCSMAAMGFTDKEGYDHARIEFSSIAVSGSISADNVFIGVIDGACD